MTEEDKAGRRAKAEELEADPEVQELMRKHAAYTRELPTMPVETLAREIARRWHVRSLTTNEFEQMTLAIVEWMRRGHDIAFFARDGPMCSRIDDSFIECRCVVQ
jgi:hypothetical protein